MRLSADRDSRPSVRMLLLKNSHLFKGITKHICIPAKDLTSDITGSNMEILENDLGVCRARINWIVLVRANSELKVGLTDGRFTRHVSLRLALRTCLHSLQEVDDKWANASLIIRNYEWRMSLTVDQVRGRKVLTYRNGELQGSYFSKSECCKTFSSAVRGFLIPAGMISDMLEVEQLQQYSNAVS